MPSSGCRISGIQSAGTAARDQDLFLLRRRLHFVAFHLAPDDRIDRTASRGGRRALCHAGKAPQAPDDLIISSLHDLARQERIRQELARHIYDICLAGSNDLFHLFRVRETADRSNGNMDVFLDLFRQIDVAAVRLKHGRMGLAEAPLIGSRGNMNNIHVILQDLRNAASLVNIIAALE